MVNYVKKLCLIFFKIFIGLFIAYLFLLAILYNTYPIHKLTFILLILDSVYLIGVTIILINCCVLLNNFYMNKKYQSYLQLSELKVTFAKKYYFVILWLVNFIYFTYNISINFQVYWSFDHLGSIYQELYFKLIILYCAIYLLASISAILNLIFLKLWFSYYGKINYMLIINNSFILAMLLEDYKILKFFNIYLLLMLFLLIVDKKQFIEHEISYNFQKTELLN